MRWDIEFALALRNRTGKYFIGRDIIEDQADLVGDIYYWRRRASSLPTGIWARLIDKGLGAELQLRRRGGAASTALRARSARPMLHLDPFTVGVNALGPQDMVLCHDLGPITHSDLFADNVAALYRSAYAEIAQVGPKMVFVSAASRRAFMECYGALSNMRVIYPPVRTDIATTAPAPVAGVTPPFLLTVGSIGRRKNQAAAIRAFARSALGAQGVQYVLCGAREPGFEEALAAARSVEGVRILPYVSEAELAWLYGAASGFVLMSRLEGFGLPVAEAISRGLAPLVSAGSVLEEVAGEAALRVDPDDGAAIAAGMVSLVGMTPDEHARRLASLQRSIARFTREAFAQGWRQALLDG